MYQALTQGKTITKVIIYYYGVNPEAQEVEIYRITLETVRFLSIKAFTVNNLAKEEISIRYSKITWLWIEGNLEYSDEWL